MRLVVDEDIVELDLYLSTLSKSVVYQKMSGREIRREHLMNAEGLMVRSITRVDESLLQGTPIRFVASATAGSDHLDQVYCQQANIQCVFAPGCNAKAVVNYVLSALWSVTREHGLLCQSKRVGIVGYGHVGQALYATLKTLGIECLIYDPLIDWDSDNRCDWQTLLAESDIITLHTPLTQFGRAPTFHLIDQAALNQMKPNACLINTARGAVVDTQALYQHIVSTPSFKSVLDVWENEPEINPLLLNAVTRGSGHIAGHSLLGKRRGTYAVYVALCRLLQEKPKNFVSCPSLKHYTVHVSDDLNKIMEVAYDFKLESDLFKQWIQTAVNPAQAFDQYRAQYTARAELSDIYLSIPPEWINNHAEDLSTLHALGFQCDELPSM